MNNTKSRFISQSAIIAALYVVLTALTAVFGLANGAIQLRLSEALAILPFFTASAIPGLFVGCLLSNILIGVSSGFVLLDIIFGSLATLIAAVIAYLLRHKSKWLSPIPNVVLNTLIVPFIIAYGYGAEESIPFIMLTVGATEIISCYILGMMLLFWVEKNRKTLHL